MNWRQPSITFGSAVAETSGHVLVHVMTSEHAAKLATVGPEAALSKTHPKRAVSSPQRIMRASDLRK